MWKQQLGNLSVRLRGRFGRGLINLISFAAVFMAGILVALLAQQAGQRPIVSDAVAPESVAPQTNGGIVRQAAPSTNTPRPAVATRTAAAQGSAVAVVAQAATETIPPYTGLPTLTPSRTLRPPPTLEPPTPTVLPSATPTITPTPTTNINVVVPGLRGAETATPSGTPGCKPRADWKLSYEVRRDDALSRIADLYNTSVDELMKANCLTNANLIVIGQHLKVPGSVPITTPEYVCVPFELLTPRDGTLDITGNGTVSFVWRGPRVPYNLIRILDSEGSIRHEVVVELRQNESFDIGVIPDGGTFTWYIYPLNSVFVQACPEGGPWKFTKDAAPKR